MSLGSATWRGRHKRASRRLRRDLRVILPMIGVLFCFASSATVIVAAEQVSLHPNPILGGYFFKISNSSTSKLSAAPAGIRPVLRLP
jgi:hypothetical protein